MTEHDRTPSNGASSVLSTRMKFLNVLSPFTVQNGQLEKVDPTSVTKQVPRTAGYMHAACRWRTNYNYCWTNDMKS